MKVWNTAGKIIDWLQRHSPTHEDGGVDEINVGGLSGLLADDQHVLSNEIDYGLSFEGVVTTATDTTHFKVSTLADKGTGFFKPAAGTPYEIYVVEADGAAPEGEQTPVVAYTTADGTFQHAEFTAQLAVGDIVLIIHPLLATLGTKATAAATGAVTTTDYLMAYIKQLITGLALDGTAPHSYDYTKATVPGWLHGFHFVRRILFVIPEAIGSITAHNTAIKAELDKAGIVFTITQADALTYPDFESITLTVLGSPLAGTAWSTDNLAHIKAIFGLPILCVDGIAAAYLAMGTDGGNAATKTVLNATARIEGSILGIGVDDTTGLAAGANTVAASGVTFATLDMSASDITEIWYAWENTEANTDVLIGQIRQVMPDGTTGIDYDGNEVPGTLTFYGCAYSMGSLNTLGQAVFHLLVEQLLHSSTAGLAVLLSGNVGNLVNTIGNKKTTAATGAVSNAKKMMAYVKQLVTQLLATEASQATHRTALTNHESSQSTHRTALTNHESSQSTHRTALTNHNTALTNHESSQSTHRGHYTSTRAGYIDNLSAGAVALASVLGALNTAAATGGVDTVTTAMGYIKQLVTAMILVLADTAELQGNQAAWATATGFATETKQDIIDGFHDVPGEDAAADAQMRDVIGKKTDTTSGTSIISISKQVKAKTDNIPASPAPAQEYDTEMARITANVALASVLGALNSAAATGAVSDVKVAMAYIKQLVTLLLNGTYGLAKIVTEINANETKIDALENLSAANVATELETYDAVKRSEATTDKNAIITEVNANETKIDTIDGIVDTLLTRITAAVATATALATVDGIVDNILIDTAVIGALGAGLTAIPWNSAWDTEVQSECKDALDTYDPPTRGEATSDKDAVIAAIPAMVGTNDAALASVLGALTDAAAEGAVTTTDTVMQYVKQLVTAVILVLADTGELQTDWANGGRLDNLLDTAAAAAGYTHTDWKGNFNWDTSAYTTVEQDISALFSTNLAIVTRRKYSVKLDLTAVEADGSFVSLYLAVKEKVDGSNYRAIDYKTVLKADIAAGAEPAIIIDIPATSENIQITMQMSTALAGDATIYYSVVKEHLE